MSSDVKQPMYVLKLFRVTADSIYSFRVLGTVKSHVKALPGFKPPWI